MWMIVTALVGFIGLLLLALVRAADREKALRGDLRESFEITRRAHRDLDKALGDNRELIDLVVRFRSGRAWVVRKARPDEPPN